MANLTQPVMLGENDQNSTVWTPESRDVAAKITVTRARDCLYG
jgi:hypothetical protein